MASRELASRALRRIFVRADAAEGDLIRSHDALVLGRAACQMLAAAGILQESVATEVVCPECANGSMVEVEPIPHRVGTPVRDSGRHHDLVEPALANSATIIASGICSSGGQPHLVRARRRDMLQWSLSLQGLARCVSRALGARGAVDVIDRERLVNVGAIEYRGSVHDLFLARGLPWPDAPSRICRAEAIRSSPRPFLIGLDRLGPPSSWTDTKPVLARLTAIASWGATGLSIDVAAVPTQTAVPSLGSGAADWITVTEAAKLLLGVRSGLSLKKAQARVSKQASLPRESRPFTTNGEKGAARRIDRHSFSTWLLMQRDTELDDLDEWVRGR